MPDFIWLYESATITHSHEQLDAVTIENDLIDPLAEKGEEKQHCFVAAAANVIGDYLNAFRIIEFAVYCSPRDLRNYDVFKRAIH